jgi:phosphohistidine swiveling domain-containing protein
MKAMVRSFDELAAGQQSSAGGKGGTLARLYRAGYPVPEGFVVLPAAFAGDELRPDAWAQVRARLARMRKGDPDVTFAVRSSALSEDSARASFAGEFETLLDVRADGQVRQAIHAVRRSRHDERVQAYSQAHGLGTAHEMAVVVQRLVRADVAGVLFTADPITGSQVGMPGNYVYGPGERLVSGDANPEVFTLKRPRGEYEGPLTLKRFARGLYRLASRLEEELGGPQDIEWAVVGPKLYLLQSRPITTLQAYNPATGEWNDSLTGDYLWTSANLGEAFPDVMTPFTWSFVQAYYRANGFRDEAARYPMGGNICGRPYMNLSVGLSASTALGLSREKVLRATAETFGLIPAEVEIPMIPFSRWWALRRFASFAFRMRWRLRRLGRRIPFFIAETPARVDALKAAIRVVRTPHDLLDLWRERLYPLLDETMLMLAAGLTEYRMLSRRLHVEFERLVGEADANVLLSGVSTGTDYLASLGLLIGLSEVSRGTMSREAYLQRYGHRGAHEMELSAPRPAEDPGWLDRRLAEIKRDSVDVSRMLAEQRRQHEAAWARLEARVGRRAGGYRRKLDRMAAAARTREASRSETVRLLGVFRAFALQAGELTGLGEDVFFLFLEEVVERLTGDASVCDAIPVRREAHARYSALPPYPTLIRGRFDPVRWAADPNRRSDYYDAYAPVPTAASATITGFAGAAGVVEGIVRRIDGPEEGDRLQPGEVLVTVATNVGWTPLFPRVAAIVTDVGAPFSHAAVVARELGIPAVVGCGDATMRLRTGDRVIVHGGRGIVEILDGDGR